jgi:amino-acid N-acetyltransferase
MDAANRLTHEILEGLSANDLRAACHECHHCPSAGNHPGRRPPVCRKVERVDIELLQTLLNRAIVPVVPPLGFDGDARRVR